VVALAGIVVSLSLASVAESTRPGSANSVMVANAVTRANHGMPRTVLTKRCERRADCNSESDRL
jgi:hypothetical protein